MLYVGKIDGTTCGVTAVRTPANVSRLGYTTLLQVTWTAAELAFEGLPLGIGTTVLPALNCLSRQSS
jgi:hypothetical protein